ncbi:hypothetical protein RHGRI_015612 [Rhododendron griersonianum]|uniref:Uncharacterized protein n=1 Tax=Rhododendron griersonianum TaxID=479676 RepID=A0AAV6KEH3_9ERIC|nr:hypothetical protein RHGRI_015612 [Rhododendron griersonianum]
MLESEHGVSGGVEQDVTTVEGEKPAFDPEHDIAVDVGGGEVALVYGEEFAGNCYVYWVRSTELSADDCHWVN